MANVYGSTIIIEKKRYERHSLANKKHIERDELTAITAIWMIENIYDQSTNWGAPYIKTKKRTPLVANRKNIIQNRPKKSTIFNARGVIQFRPHRDISHCSLPKINIRLSLYSVNVNVLFFSLLLYFPSMLSVVTPLSSHSHK